MTTVFEAPGSRVMTRPVLVNGCPSTSIAAVVLSAVAVRMTEPTFDGSRAS